MRITPGLRNHANSCEFESKTGRVLFQLKVKHNLEQKDYVWHIGISSDLLKRMPNVKEFCQNVYAVVKNAKVLAFVFISYCYHGFPKFLHSFQYVEIFTPV